MKRSIILILLGLVTLMSLLAAQAAFAGDVSISAPLDPDANACFEGGSLAGKCDTEAMWVAGWLLIRFEHGLLPASAIPSEYAWIVGGHADDGSHDDGSHGSDEICTDPVPH